jgi:hypothetical protein
MFSIFESCTEWIAKGKLRPAVEPGEKVNLASDQSQLILDYETVDNKTGGVLVLDLADRLTGRFIILRVGWHKSIIIQTISSPFMFLFIV